MKKPYLPYNKKLKQFSRNLRSNSTLSEVLLWNELKAAKLRGYKFNRQKPLRKYIVDFYCKKLNLVIEIDGESHVDKEESDTIRQKELEKIGLKFLRFEDSEVKQDIDSVLRRINSFIDEYENARREESP
jgi:very-short-patch-repair endonuclease